MSDTYIPTASPPLTDPPNGLTPRPDIAAALEGVRVRGRVFCTIEAGVPWGMRGGPDNFATFHAITGGCDAWLRVQGIAAALPLRAGQVAVMPGGALHAVSDQPDRMAVPFSMMASKIDANGRLRLGGDGVRTHVLCGAFHHDDRDAPPIFGLLPPVIVVDADPALAATVSLVVAESTARGPAWREVIARALPILFVQVLRTFARGADETTLGGLVALADPRIARALTAIHHDLASSWTVDALARIAAMSRTAFHDRFVALLGRPPVRYVTAVRMSAAADALARSDHGLAEIAAQVGYRAEEAFCRSFKRHFGVTAGQWRREARQAFPDAQ